MRRDGKEKGRTLPSTSAGEEATRLGFQKLWTAAVLSHRPFCCFPCWGTNGIVPRTGLCLRKHVSASTFLEVLKIKHRERTGPRHTSEIRGQVIELKVGWEGHVLPWQAYVTHFQVVGVTTG